MKKKMLRLTGIKKSFPALIIFAGLIGLLSSCSKGDNSGNNGNGGSLDITAPILDIFSPIPNQVFASGNTINITGRVTDDLGLFRGSIRVTNDANGNILKEQLYEIHYALLYNFNINYTPTVSVPSDYTVTVFFEDHGNNNATKSVKIKVNP